MTEEGNDFVVTPKEAYLAIEGGFFAVVGERVGGRTGPGTGPAGFEEVTRSAKADIEAGHASWAVDEQSRELHLPFASLALAGYRILLQILPKNEALALVREALVGPSRPHMLGGTKAALDHAHDPFDLMRNISKEKEAGFYGRTFAFERPQDDEHAYLVNITGCFWNSFFARNGAPELMPAFCDFDTNWMDAVEPGRHGFRSERPTTLGYGGDRCRFWLIRAASSPNDETCDGR